MIGETIAHYEITEKIGAGGMGEVFRARDTKLNRDVALKIIPEVFAADAQRMGRFQREAQLLASLNHANIAAIYGVEESGGKRALVLELVRGEDLSQKLKTGVVPVDEALEIAVQIAEALEAAHDKGVVHRDLKPGNVMITSDGKVKVLDFGLAKALEGDADSISGDHSQSLSPTLTQAATKAGVVLGTAAYMSPEQARGKSVDRRTDIWAFGVVLFEMLVRRQMFGGETISDTLAAVIKDDPDWSLLPEDTPRPVVDLLGRCLQKDARRRLQSIGEARIALEDIIHPYAGAGAPSTVSSGPVPSVSGAAAPAGDSGPASMVGSGRGPGRGPLLWAVMVILAGLLGLWVGASFWRQVPEPTIRKFHIDHEELQVSYPTNPAISPDGTHIAYYVGPSLWIRDLGTLEAIEVGGSEGSQAPFWSPDGEWVAFGIGNRIMKVPASGGAAQAICDVPFVALDGGTWGEDGMLVLAPNSGPMYIVSSRGGDPKPLFPVKDNESDYHTPSALPEGKGILFTSHRDEGRDTLEVFAGGQRKQLLRIAGARLEYAAWAPSGHIVYHRMNTNTGIWAVPFDLDALEITGEPFILDPDGFFSSVARDGTLVYALGSGSGQRELAVVSRQGEILRTIGQPQAGMVWPELSPDGTAVLVSALEADNRDIWLVDLERETRTRMTFGNETDIHAIWVNGGREIAFTNGSGATTETFRRASDGSGEPQSWFMGYQPSFRDGVDWVVFDRFEQDGGPGIYVLPMDASGEPTALVQTEAAEMGPQLSPDGRFVIYMSNESGGNEVYVTSFPEGDGKWQVSVNSGAWPRWSRDGTEIIYREGSGAGAVMVSVPFQSVPSVRLGNPVRLFGSREADKIEFGAGFRGFDVLPGDDAFVMLQVAGDERDHRTRLVFSENWYEAYRKGTE